jgi:hypothetical protein
MKTFKLSQFIYNKEKNQLSACVSDVSGHAALFDVYSEKTGQTIRFRYANVERQGDEIVSYIFIPSVIPPGTNPNLKLILWND